MKKNIILSFLFFTSLVFAQQEASNWYFGSSAGIKFLPDGSVVPLPNSNMTAQHGCATVSDENGNLLFYSNGEEIWNKNHQKMSNGSGLSGSFYANQSTFILKKPGSFNLFYVFTNDLVSGGKGLRYSEVNMNLDGGLGAVTANKNIVVLNSSCEKIAVVKHANGVDYWVVAHEFNSNAFFSYLVTSFGINFSGVKSNAGSIINNTPAGPISASGGMKIAPDGSRLAVCNKFSNIELFDFDTSTGKISNAKVILNGNYESYSVEFSPNSKVLYASVLRNGVLFQYDLNSTDIASSKIEIARSLTSNGGLQLGINGKIYLSIFSGTTKLSVINNPDNLGLDCDFQYNSVAIAGTQFYGLPLFSASIFNQLFTVNKLCFSDATEFTLLNVQPSTTAIWNFGDGSTSTSINPKHTYSSPGNYTVSVSINGNVPKTKNIVISHIPTATKPQNILICDSNNDGLYSFDLTVQNSAILNGQDPTLNTVKYFANATDYANNVTILNPTRYSNSISYQLQTIIAEVSNNNNSTCKSTSSFDIAVFDRPIPSLADNIPNLSSCDNNSVGTDMDGKVVFDLSQRASIILNGQLSNQFLLSYFKDAALTQVIATPTAYQNTNSSEAIYVKMANKDNPVCFETTSFNIQVFALPVITSTVDLKQCDDNIDGFSFFNLEEAIPMITANASTETITFFKTLLDAQNSTKPIMNPTTYSNQTVSNDLVYVRVSNTDSCFRIAKLNLIVSTTQIPLDFAKTFTVCDDAVFGTNTDGISSFDFSSVTNQIQNIFPVGQLLDITYYKNINDALAEKNTISAISNYRNSGYPITQKIYIRVESRLNNECLGLGAHITLNVESIPIAKSLIENHCDDDQDGKYAFDTTTIQTRLLNGLTNVKVTYYDQNNKLLSSPLPNPFVTSSQTLKVIVTNNTLTACSYESTIQFVVDVLPQAFAVPAVLTTTCDDESNPRLQDGKFAFDTSTFQNTILGGQNGMTIKYFDASNNFLFNTIPNPFVTTTQNIRVEVTNPINTSCKATIVLPFVVNPVPNINLIGDELVCSNLTTFTKIIDAGIQDGISIMNYKYVWTCNGNVIPNETNYSLTVNKAGTYTVEVTNTQGCSRTRTITVSASDIAKIESIDSTELASSNSIRISITGAGNYVFALDDITGTYQKENFFNNVSAGIHTVFIKDLNGCGILPKEVAILGIPNFFTPNNDGDNDYWNIKGVNTAFNSKTRISIFDRYGKLIKQINPLIQGWDGTFNGQQLPADDYWYFIQFEDARVVKGHFSLIR